MAPTCLKCPKCHSALTVSNGNAGNGLLRCEGCGAHWQRGQDNFFDLRGRVVETQVNFQAQEKATYCANEVISRFLYAQLDSSMRNIVEYCGARTILDVGCGNGAYGRVFEDFVDCYVGLDPSDIPPSRQVKHSPKALLVHNDPSKPVPIADDSIDLAMFLGSYQVLDDRIAVLRDIWRTIRPGGHVVISMTSDDFWIKKIVRLLRRDQWKPKGHSLYEVCDHGIASLKREIKAAIPGAELALADADFCYLPGRPQLLRHVYRSDRWVRTLNSIAHTLASVFGRNTGSTMNVAFRKIERPAVTR
jgi:SAM-dependent methyltransferase